MNRFLNWLMTPYYRIKHHFALKKRMRETRKRDPFIY